MRRTRKQPIAISEAELVGMTHDLDDAHHESLPSMRDSLDEWSESSADIRRAASRTSCRRLRAVVRFLFGGGAVLGGVALVGSGCRQRPRRRRHEDAGCRCRRSSGGQSSAEAHR